MHQSPSARLALVAIKPELPYPDFTCVSIGSVCQDNLVAIIVVEVVNISVSQADSTLTDL